MKLKEKMQKEAWNSQASFFRAESPASERKENDGKFAILPKCQEKFYKLFWLKGEMHLQKPMRGAIIYPIMFYSMQRGK